MRKSETKRLNAANSISDSTYIPSIWLGKTTESDEHIFGTALEVYTAKSVRAKNDQEIWNSDLIKSVRGTLWWSENNNVADARRATQAKARLEHEQKNPLIILGCDEQAQGTRNTALRV